MFDPYYNRRLKARLQRERKLSAVATQGLPIDGDNAETRKPLVRAGDMFDAAIGELRDEIFKEEASFFDTVREAWPKLFPNLPMRPGRWQEGRIVLYVANAGQAFAMRSRLPAVKKQLKTLPGAPGTFTLLVEIHKFPDSLERSSAR